MDVLQWNLTWISWIPGIYDFFSVLIRAHPWSTQVPFAATAVREVDCFWLMIWDGEGGNTRDGDCGMSIHFQDCTEILDNTGMYVIVCVCFLDLSKGCSFVVLEVLYLQKLIDTSGMFVATTGILSCFQWFTQLMMSWNDLVQSIILESKITLYNHYTKKKNRIQRSIWPTKKIYNTGFHYPLQSGFWNRTWNRHPYESTRILIWYRWWKKSQTTTLDV